MEELLSEDYEQKVSGTTIATMLIFGSNDCEPCKALKPTIEKLAEKYEYIQFYYIDLFKSREISTMYRIQTVPSIVMTRRYGVAIGCLEGNQPAHKIEELLALAMSR